MQFTFRQELEFKQIFKLELSKYWNRILGFDILKFESDLKLESASLSVGEVIIGRFGIDAYNLIDELLKER
jgi:hypothetical protein